MHVIVDDDDGCGCGVQTKRNETNKMKYNKHKELTNLLTLQASQPTTPSRAEPKKCVNL